MLSIHKNKLAAREIDQLNPIFEIMRGVRSNACLPRGEVIGTHFSHFPPTYRPTRAILVKGNRHLPHEVRK